MTHSQNPSPGGQPTHKPHELAYLARMHKTSVAEIERVIRRLGPRSASAIEAELARHYDRLSRWKEART